MKLQPVYSRIVRVLRTFTAGNSTLTQPNAGKSWAYSRGSRLSSLYREQLGLLSLKQGTAGLTQGTALGFSSLKEGTVELNSSLQPKAGSIGPVSIIQPKERNSGLNCPTESREAWAYSSQSRLRLNLLSLMQGIAG
jgi:hypothetical protein